MKKIPENVCKYCQRAFTREQTLSVHMCEPKRRFKQKNEKHVIIGFNAYLKFFEVTQGNSKNKTYEQFSVSPYYSACVKFGRYTMDINCINTAAYTEFLIKNNCPIDKWCSDKVYESFLQIWIYAEDHFDAAQRSLAVMMDWADEQKCSFLGYFRYAANSRIISDILRGRMSGWVIYCCESGQSWLEKLTAEELSLIWSWISSDRWKSIFLKYPDRKIEITDLLLKAGV